MKTRSQQGQSLVEIIVAVGVVILLVMGIVVATTTSLRSGQRGKDKGLAVKYAQEGIELVRDLRNQGWIDFQSRDGLWCLAKDGTWTKSLGTCDANIDNLYTRGVTFGWDAGNSRMNVVVVVSWSDGDIPRDVKLETFLTQWQ